MLLFSFLLLLTFVMFTVVFFTLMELKILGYFHVRLGPDKVGFFGYFQSLADFFKLLEKSFSYFLSIIFFEYYFSPLLGLFFGLFIWVCYFGIFSFYYFFFLIMLFFCLTSISVFFFLLSGWSSGSVFSSYGSYRASVQVISYEVSMMFILINFLLLFFSFDLFFFFDFFSNLENFFFFSPLFVCWLICILSESNRAPFDFSEGESELVSGFNIEYSGGMFSFIFLSEYSLMIYFSFLSAFFFLGTDFLFLKFIFFFFFYIWVRGTFPRLRFDKLMLFNWKSVLPLVLSYFCFFCFLSLFFSEDSLIEYLLWSHKVFSFDLYVDFYSLFFNSLCWFMFFAGIGIFSFLIKCWIF